MRVVIEIRVAFQTPLHVGSGALAESGVDKPTTKDINFMPIVPGSSLKGRTRHECERIVRALTGEENAVCHGPAPENMCPLDPARLALPEEEAVCPVCLIFGSPWLPSRARFSDLEWQLSHESRHKCPLDTMIRYGVSINRLRRVAEEQRLFTIESFALTRETIFYGHVTGDFPDNDRDRYGQVGLLVAGLRSITSLGGERSRGLGWCKVEAKPMEFIGDRMFAIQDHTLKGGLLQWLRLT